MGVRFAIEKGNIRIIKKKTQKQPGLNAHFLIKKSALIRSTRPVDSGIWTMYVANSIFVQLVYNERPT